MRFVYSWFSSVCDKVSTNEAVARVLTLSNIKSKIMTIQKLARYWYWSEHSPAFRTTVYWVTRLCIRTCLGKRRGWNSKKLHVTLIDKKSLSQQWQYLQPCLSNSDLQGAHLRQWNQRLILKAICYLVTTGCQWRMLPKDLATWQSVYCHYRKWC